MSQSVTQHQPKKTTEPTNPPQPTKREKPVRPRHFVWRACPTAPVAYPSDTNRHSCEYVAGRITERKVVAAAENESDFQQYALITDSLIY